MKNIFLVLGNMPGFARNHDSHLTDMAYELYVRARDPNLTQVNYYDDLRRWLDSFEDRRQYPANRRDLYGMCEVRESKYEREGANLSQIQHTYLSASIALFRYAILVRQRPKKSITMDEFDELIADLVQLC